MNALFARRMELVRASEIREILKVTARPEIISFAGGLPAPELFPVAEILAATQAVLENDGPRALQYSTTEGHPRLREQIAARGNALWGTRHAPGDVLVTTGSQQGLDLIGKLFLDDGDAVLCESPTYIGAISAWNVFRPYWVPVPTDDEGMLPDALEALLARTARVKLVYAIPNFQNPSGRTWSLERRRALAAAAARHGIPVVEDNPYGELRFRGAHLPAIGSLPEAGEVITLGTFSKIFCPGLRIAFVAGSAPIVEKLVVLKQGADLHTSTLNQMQLAEYLDRNDLDAAVRRLCEVYAARRDAMVTALEREMPAGVTFTRPDGGLFLWVDLPEGVDARELLRRAIDAHVAFVPGGAFFPDGRRQNCMRLNYSNMPPERIEEGVRRLAALIQP